MTNEFLIEDLTLLRLPQWWESPWFLLSAPVAAGILLYLVTRWWMSRRPAPQAVPVPEGPPVHDGFLRRLQELRARRDSLEAYPLGIEVSEILRGYLEARFRFGIRYQTTREFLDSVAADTRLKSGHREVLTGFLGLCDAVKFARHDVARPGREGLLDTAEQFIRDSAGLPPENGGGR
jgi:hypothetical protein